MKTPSATETGTSLGTEFAEALAAKDAARLRGLLADAVDFRALTPRRCWEADNPAAVVDEIVLGQWFDPDTDVVGLLRVTTSRVEDRASVTYRMLVDKPGGRMTIEQTAYYSTEAGRISWMRLLCSGFRPLDGEDGKVS